MCVQYVQYVVFNSNFYGLILTQLDILSQKTRKILINSPSVNALSVMHNVIWVMISVGLKHMEVT